MCVLRDSIQFLFHALVKSKWNKMSSKNYFSSNNRQKGEIVKKRYIAYNKKCILKCNYWSVINMRKYVFWQKNNQNNWSLTFTIWQLLLAEELFHIHNFPTTMNPRSCPRLMGFVMILHLLEFTVTAWVDDIVSVLIKGPISKKFFLNRNFMSWFHLTCLHISIIANCVAFMNLSVD